MARASMPQGTATVRRRSRWTRVACALALAMAACGDDGPHVRYRMVGLPRATGDGCAATELAPPVIAGATRARLTFRDETPAGPGPLRCDLVLPLGTPAPLVAVPRRGAHVALWVEYFDDAGNLLARGARRDVAIDDGETIAIEVAPTGDFACASVQATRARAFHSATLLPTGEVLLLGGVAGSLVDHGASFAPDDGAYALATAELYDPVARTSEPVTIPGLLPRAFHQTIVVGEDDAGVHLLVVGGEGVNADPTSAGNVVVTPGGSGAPPWQPAGIDPTRGRYGARGLPAELVTYDPRAHGFTRVELGETGPTARTEAAATAQAGPTGAVAIVGGRTANGAASALVEAVRADGLIGGTASGRLRVGATVTMLPTGDAIVVGGDLGPDPASVRAVDHLSALDGAPAIDTGPADTSASNRAFHAAAVLGGDHVVAIGGLHLGGSGVEDHGPADVVARVSNSSLALAAIDPAGMIATAYLDAASLHDGGVLAAGGARPAGACSRSIVCPASQALRVDPDGGGARVGAAGSLGLARYGHRVTRLADGTVLVTGGLVLDPADPERLRATSAVEQFEAHRAVDDPLADLMITRAAGDVARDAMGVAIAECGTLGGVPAPVDAAVDGVVDAEVDAAP
jgi:hypothetical protein